MPPPASVSRPASRANRARFPRISIVTPNFNQAHDLNACIRSVLSQNYPNLEYFVVDGGSTDGSVDIIRSFAAELDGWSSGPDAGQSDALNRGFAQCSGDVLFWLCADDCLLPETLNYVAAQFRAEPTLDVLSGACECLYEAADHAPLSRQTRPSAGTDWLATPYAQGVWQPSCFFRRHAVQREEVVRNDLHYCMDRELWCHLTLHGARWQFTDRSLGLYRYTGCNKSMTGQAEIIREISLIFQSWSPRQRWLPGLLQACWLPAALQASQAVESETTKTPRQRAARWRSAGASAALLSCFAKRDVRTLQREFFSYAYWNQLH